MVVYAFFMALILLMTFVPNIGYIPTPWLKITLIHIPVIIAGITYGPKVGAFMGFVFGLSSFISNTISPTVLSFVFTPFYQIGEVGGRWYSLIICFVPRILTGLFPALIVRAMKNRPKTGIAVGAFAGSAVNTILVLGSILVLYTDQFAKVKDIGSDAVAVALGGIVLVNGIPEAIAAVLMSLAIVPVMGMIHRRKR